MQRVVGSCGIASTGRVIVGLRSVGFVGDTRQGVKILNQIDADIVTMYTEFNFTVAAITFALKIPRPTVSRALKDAGVLRKQGHELRKKMKKERVRSTPVDANYLGEEIHENQVMSNE